MDENGRRIILRVEAIVPYGVSPLEFAHYAEGEIKAGIGGLHPDEGLFQLDRNSVSVKAVRK